jgi:MATE family multidrug resistance protein
MSMSIVDTIMVGRLPDSATAIGATALGSGLFYTVSICCGGLLLGLDTLVSQSFGRGDVEDCNHSLLQALYIAAFLCPFLLAFDFYAPHLLADFGIASSLVQGTKDFLYALAWSAPPLLAYFALRRYLQAIHRVRIVMYALVSANIINLGLNWLLIYPHYWSGRLVGGWGLAGSGWSTFWARIYMSGVLAAALFYYNRVDRLHLRRTDPSLDWPRIKRLLQLGGPAATQIFLEIAVFSFTGILAGKLGALPLAAHQIALQCAALSYMVPLGVSAAAAVRTGNAWGRGELREAHHAGRAAVVLGCGFMALAAILFVLIPRPLARIFSPDPQVVAMGARLLLVAAAFQLFDGLQTVATGALRGIGSTQLPMISNFIGYWIIGLPIGAVLCFHWGLGVFGLWIGLCIGLIVISVVLFGAWEKRFAEREGTRYSASA